MVIRKWMSKWLGFSLCFTRLVSQCAISHSNVYGYMLFTPGTQQNYFPRKFIFNNIMPWLLPNNPSSTKQLSLFRFQLLALIWILIFYLSHLFLNPISIFYFIFFYELVWKYSNLPGLDFELLILNFLA